MGNCGFSEKTGAGTARPHILRQRDAKKFRKIIDSPALSVDSAGEQEPGRDVLRIKK
jgi:hypothetical protein